MAIAALARVERCKVMGGSAFVPFHPVDHPTLGKVEVGGWKPGVRLNPPIEQVSAIVDTHLAFLKDLAGRLPSLSIKEAKAEAKGGGIYEVKATVENTGTLPTALAQGVTTRKALPVLVKLEVGDAKLLSGRALNRINAHSPDGRHTVNTAGWSSCQKARRRSRSRPPARRQGLGEAGEGAALIDPLPVVVVVL